MNFSPRPLKENHMKTLTIASVAALAALLTGCASEPAPTPAPDKAPAEKTKAVSYELGSKKIGDKGVCVICASKPGAHPEEEEVKVVMDYKGRTYVFCELAEEAEFISSPEKYAGL